MSQPASPSAPVVRLSDVTVRRGSTVALHEVDLVVGAGEVVGVLGPNGAGKTTMLEIIQGYLTPAGGTARVFGVDPAADTHDIAHRWAVMPQISGLPMGLTAREAVSLFRDLHGSTASVDEVLDTTGLTPLAGRRWRTLSGGEQQRLSLAVALCGGTDLVMLDEPTAAVDAAGRDRILELIARLGSSGSTVLLTTHRFDDVDDVASRAVVLHRGRIVADGPVAELTSDQEHVRFDAAPGLHLAGLSAALGPAREIAPGRYEVDLPAGSVSVAALAGWLADHAIDASSIESGRTSLEHLYRELTGGAE